MASLQKILDLPFGLNPQGNPSAVPLLTASVLAPQNKAVSARTGKGDLTRAIPEWNTRGGASEGSPWALRNLASRHAVWPVRRCSLRRGMLYCS